MKLSWGKVVEFFSGPAGEECQLEDCGTCKENYLGALDKLGKLTMEGAVTPPFDCFCSRYLASKDDCIVCWDHFFNSNLARVASGRRIV